MDEQAQRPRYIWGAKAIGDEIGVMERQSFHMLESGQLPAKKVNGRWLAEAGRLHARMVGDDGEEAA